MESKRISRRQLITQGASAIAMLGSLSTLVSSTKSLAGWDDEIPASGETSLSVAPIDELMLSFLKKHLIPGASIAIGKKGRLLYSRGFGYADRDSKTPVQTDSLFRIASISKPITAVAILQLIQQRKLDWNTTPFELLKWRQVVDERLKGVTVRQLLQHTAGFDRSASFDPMFITRKIAKERGLSQPIGNQAIIDYMLDHKLDFAPGSKYAYSNFGYCILGRVIERITGLVYEEAIKSSICRPLGLESMHIGQSMIQHQRMNEVHYYDQKNRTSDSVVGEIGAKVPSPYGEWDQASLDSHGGWIATPADLIRFSMSLEPTSMLPLLDSDSLQKMWSKPDLPSDQISDVYYGCGWNVRRVSKNKFNYWHTGELPGTAGILVHRHDGFHWAVLFNTQYTEAGKNAAGEIDGLVHEAVDKVGDWQKGLS